MGNANQRGARGERYQDEPDASYRPGEFPICKRSAAFRSNRGVHPPVKEPMDAHEEEAGRHNTESDGQPIKPRSRPDVSDERRPAEKQINHDLKGRTDPEA